LVPQQSANSQIVLVALEVTEQKRMEKALQHQSQYIASVHATTFGIMNRLDIQALLKPIITRLVC